MYFISFFRNIIEYIYIKYNKNPVIYKRDFNDLSYFEKLFLVLFYRKNIFSNSIANIFTNNNLFNYRKKKYPLIFFFHLYFDKMDYKFSSLKKLNKFFNFFKKSKVFTRVFTKFQIIFFKKRSFYTIFLVLQKTLYKRYYNLCSSPYFKDQKENNLVKLNWMFYLFLKNSNGKKVIYDLSKYTDWYDFNFKPKKKIILNKTVLNKKRKKEINDFKLKRFNYLFITYYKYNLFFKKLFNKLNLLYKNVYVLNFKIFNKSKFILNSNWKNKLLTFYPIRFSESSVSKHIMLDNINTYTFFYIRKNRIFNKGRYSRNRQLYRTGVYWCLWLNIILVYGLYFLFYRFTFNFGYFWWGILILAYSTIFSRAVKYNFFNIYYIYNECNNFIKWCGFIFLNLRDFVITFLKTYWKFFKNNFIFFKFYEYVLKFLRREKNEKFIYFWEYMTYKDESFLRYKSIIHWFTQLYKLLTY